MKWLMSADTMAFCQTLSKCRLLCQRVDSCKAVCTSVGISSMDSAIPGPRGHHLEGCQALQPAAPPCSSPLLHADDCSAPTPLLLLPGLCTCKDNGMPCPEGCITALVPSLLHLFPDCSEATTAHTRDSVWPCGLELLSPVECPTYCSQASIIKTREVGASLRHIQT